MWHTRPRVWENLPRPAPWGRRIRRQPGAAGPHLRPRQAITRPRVAPTPAGWIALVLAVALAVAGVNAGVNILFLLSGVLLGAVLVSFVGAWRQLVGITVVRQLPTTVHAGQAFTVELRLANHKNRPAHALLLEDLVRRTPRGWSAFAPRVAPRSVRHLHYPARVAQRGVVQFEGVRLSTLFPFGLVRSSMLLAGGSENELVVYPALGAVRPSFLQGQLAGVRERGSLHPSRIGATDIHGLREYRIGDNPKWIHWRRSASLGRPLVKEFDREEARRVHVVLDAVLPAGAGEADRQCLEQAISFAATLAAASTRATREVGLTVVGAEPMDLPPAAGLGQVRMILEALARVVPSSGGPAPAPPEDRRLLRNTAVVLLAVSPARAAGLPAAAWQAPGGSVRVMDTSAPAFAEQFDVPDLLR